MHSVVALSTVSPRHCSCLHTLQFNAASLYYTTHCTLNCTQQTQCANHMAREQRCANQVGVQKFWCNGSFLLAPAVSRVHCSVIPTHTGAIIAAAPTHHPTSSTIFTKIHKYKNTGPNCSGPNLPFFKGRQLDPGQPGPGAQLSGAQFATF